MKYKFLGHVGQMSFLTAPNRPSPIMNQTFRAGRSECQSAQTSKITNDTLTWSGTGCFIAVPIWQQWALKG